MGAVAMGVAGGVILGGMMSGGGGGTTISMPESKPSTEETALLQEILAQMQAPDTPEQTKMNEYTMQLLEAQIANLPIQQEYQQMALDLMQQQVAELTSPEAQLQRQVQTELAQWQLEGIQQVREMGAISGELTSSEISALDTIEQNAINTLQTEVGIDAKKVMEDVVAQMVDRGVLQGDIGAQAIAEVGKRQSELLTQGIASIESTRMSQQLGLQSDKANRELAWRQALMSGAISTSQYQEGVEADLTNSLAGIASTGRSMQSQALQYSSGLSQTNDLAKLNAAISQWGQMANVRGNEANMALQAAIASAESESAENASKWGAFGAILGAGASAYGTYAGLAAA